jgi:hypothetical protein
VLADGPQLGVDIGGTQRVINDCASVSWPPRRHDLDRESPDSSDAWRSAR